MHALTMAGSLVLTLSVVIPSFAFNGQVTSLLAPRVFPALSMVACLHCLLAVWSPSPDRRVLVTAAIQLALIFLVVHLRSTAAWQVTIIALSALFVIILSRREISQQSASAKRRFPSGAIVLLVGIVAGVLTLQVWRHVAYPDDYRRGDQILTRVFWHNIYSGLAFSDVIRERESLRIDDVSVIRATGRYLVSEGRDEEWAGVGGLTDNFSGIRWAPYDDVVRQMLSHTCKTLLYECLVEAPKQKLLALGGTLAWLFGIISEPPRLELFSSVDVGDTVRAQVLEATRMLDERGQRRSPLTWRVLVVLLAFLSFALVSRSQFPVMPGLCLALGSLIPTLAGYPAAHAVAEPALAAGLLLHGLVFLVVLRLIQGGMKPP